jgi:outer membrane protein insertion porin family
VGLALQDYELHFTEPWFLGKRLIFDVDFFHRQNFYNALHGDYNTTSDGGTISLTKALGSQFLKGTVSYTLENVHLAITPGYQSYTTTNYLDEPGHIYEGETYNGPTVSTNIQSERGSYFISKFGGNIEYDTRNSYRQPNAGQDSSLSVQVATPPGDVDFYKFELRSRWYFKGFATNHVLELAGRGGVVAPYSDTSRVPIFERYTLGGMYSLRGYRYETVGPLDSLGEALGGDTYWFASAEYSIPVISIIRWAFFYDIGNVYTLPYSFHNDPGYKFFNDDVGMGFIIVLPIGGGTPLRLDYGVPIIHDITASKYGRFQFGFGFSRPF